jgi:nucleoporin NUP82
MLETIDLDTLSYFRTQQPPAPASQGGIASRGLQTLLTSATLPQRFLLHNHPTFVLDLIYEDTVFVYHSFGVHAIWLGWIEDLRFAFKKSLLKKGDNEGEALQELVNGFIDRENNNEGLSSATQLINTVDAASKYVCSNQRTWHES